MKTGVREWSFLAKTVESTTEKRFLRYSYGGFALNCLSLKFGGRAIDLKVLKSWEDSSIYFCEALCYGFVYIFIYMSTIADFYTYICIAEMNFWYN